MNLLCVFAVLTLTSGIQGCATWELEDRCEQTNWFRYSEELAFRGQHLEDDRFLQQCKGVDRYNFEQSDLGFKNGREKLCNLEEIFQKGKTGQTFSYPFCDGLNPVDMRFKYQSGLNEFCTEENGLAYGESGETYQHVCSADQERVFLGSYYMGRRDYFAKNLEEETRAVNSLRQEISTDFHRENEVSAQFDEIPKVEECGTVSEYDATLARAVNRTTCEEPWYIRMERDSLFSQLSDVRRTIASRSEDLKTAESKVQVDRDELNKIPASNFPVRDGGMKIP